MKRGIDPNNHRPGPALNRSAQISDEDESSVSQSGSGHEPGESNTTNASSFIPDLNLDLTIGAPLMEINR